MCIAQPSRPAHLNPGRSINKTGLPVWRMWDSRQILGPCSSHSEAAEVSEQGICTRMEGTVWMREVVSAVDRRSWYSASRQHHEVCQPLHLQQELPRIITVFKTLALCFSYGSFNVCAWTTRSYFSVRSWPAYHTIRQRMLIRTVLPEDHSPFGGCGGALVAISPCILWFHPVSHEVGALLCGLGE